MLLHAAFGQDEASHGMARYPVDADGVIRVPLEAVGPLIWTGGFALSKPAAELVSVGVLKLHHSDAAGCCYRGCRFTGDENGDVLVPAEAACELLAHGFGPEAADVTPATGRAKPMSGKRLTKG
jgi:hypothetical protein